MEEIPQAQDPAEYEYDLDSETQLPIEVYEGMSEGAVSDFLRQQGIPDKYCDIFEGRAWVVVFTNIMYFC